MGSSSSTRRSDELAQQLAESRQRMNAMQAQMDQEKKTAEKRRNDMEKQLREDLTASETKRREIEDALRAEILETAQRQRATEEQLRLEKEAVEKRQRELEEEIRQEKERARAAQVAKELFEENWRKGVPPGLESLTQEQIAQARSSYLDGKVHIAIAGNSGTGKSTLVNSIRGIKAREFGAAKVGQNECTRKTTRYSDPLRPQHVWYDVPGAGTLEIPDWQYFMDQELYKYDALVVVFSDRLMRNDLRVLGNAAELGIPTFLVRSKSDQIIRNMEVDHEEGTAEMKAQYVRETHEYVRGVLEQVEEVNQEQKVYMISRDGVLRAVQKREPSPYGLDEEQLLRDWVKLHERAG